MQTLKLAIRRFSHFVVLFVAVAGFLFGQLFSGHFSPGATAAGLGGLGVGMLGLIATSSTTRKIVLACATGGILGAFLHVYEYYSSAPLAGNYYAWFLTGPFLICLVIVARPSFRSALAP